jgi:hypothetical protein
MCDCHCTAQFAQHVADKLRREVAQESLAAAGTMSKGNILNRGQQGQRSDVIQEKKDVAMGTFHNRLREALQCARSQNPQADVDELAALTGVALMHAYPNGIDEMAQSMIRKEIGEPSSKLITGEFISSLW